jgi:hypothetical protein
MSELSRKEQFLRAIFDVVVPRGAGLAAVAPGSGMVASYSRPGHVVVDFEGDLYADPDSGRTYAASRHLFVRPTIARREVRAEQVTRVGTYCVDTGIITLEPDPRAAKALRRWLGVDAVDLGPQLATGENTRHQMQRQGLLPPEPPRESLYCRVGMDAGRP